MPFEWTLDNSFWLQGEPPAPSEMLSLCREAVGVESAHALVAEPQLIDAYEQPSDGRRAHTYRFVYRSSVLPLTKERALGLNAIVCEVLGRRCLCEPRVPSQATIDRGGVPAPGDLEARSHPSAKPSAAK